ncbi:hypothetical protein F4777DRAFT_564140 [Nemania sp. FL0916]|nr:hypothetical protein F4777DRAFT_564140 [Nemania sp. FL0916]
MTGCARYFFCRYNTHCIVILLASSDFDTVLALCTLTLTLEFWGLGSRHEPSTYRYLNGSCIRSTSERLLSCT